MKLQRKIHCSAVRCDKIKVYYTFVNIPQLIGIEGVNIPEIFMKVVNNPMHLAPVVIILSQVDAKILQLHGICNFCPIRTWHMVAI